MKALSLVVTAVLLGGMFQIAMTLFGARIAGWIWGDGEQSQQRELRQLTGLMMGCIVYAVLAGVAMALWPAAVRYLLWAVLAYVIADGRYTVQVIRQQWRGMLLSLLYGLTCFTILLGYEYGTSRGENIFWSIYKLAAITPGDAPQGLFQAQFLHYGHSLLGLRDFSIFDRPFLGGVVSQAALSAGGLAPGQQFNEYPADTAYAYVALWTWLNAAIVPAVLALGRHLAKGDTLWTGCMLLLLSPCLVLNTLGTWPKLFAVAMSVCAALMAWEGRWKWAILLSGFAFYFHGSFLWSHLALSAVLALYILLSQQSIARRWWMVAGLILFAAAFPFMWFLAQHISNVASPLKAYYLYGVPVNAAFTQSMEEIARNFYRSTTPQNLAILPFINFLKSILPHEVLLWLLSFSYVGTSDVFGNFETALFYTQVNRPLFAFGLASGAMVCIGIRRHVGSSWALSLALIAFFLLPLVPGMGLYRRDDHFILGIMLFALIPVVIAFFLALRDMSPRRQAGMATLILIEYAILYGSRYKGVHYDGHFFEYYMLAVMPMLAVAWLLIMRRLAPWRGREITSKPRNAHG